jgi:hypothetical protein
VAIWKCWQRGFIPSVARGEDGACLCAARGIERRPRKQVVELESLLQARVDGTPQFVQLKAMLTKKNAKMKTMREALAGFGWIDSDCDN